MFRLPRILAFNLACCALFASLSLPVFAAEPAAAQNIAQKTAGMQHFDGLFPLNWDAKTGHLFLEIKDLDRDFLLLDSIPYGLGSNDIGLDRGQLGRGSIVHFTRSGPRILLVEPNLQYRSTSPNAEERLAVKQSFAESVLWGFKVEAEEGTRILVDATDFFLRDAHGVAERLQQTQQGSYKVDANRSTITLENTKAFPLNTEVESILTFASDGTPRGRFVASVTPDPHAITLREHTSMVQLPEPGYKPRVFDPRAGFNDVSFRDYSAPLGDSVDVRYIARHRLEKKDPKAAISEPIKPIIYYVDPGAPEPIRSALVEGANWWSQAFEAAGFKNAFKVEVLPAGADIMDVRYNTIEWVHRSTRGWSYGESITDPRTGEIIKGQVTLGSLRARQDYLIAEALLSPYVQGKPVTDEIKQMVLARIRQLAAHEVGHTLGLQHNFAASSIAFGTSVMDYPHPYVTLDAQGRPDLSHAYPIGIGTWDKAAITYGYSEFAPGTDEHAALEAMLKKASSGGMQFITDEDSRPLGSAHPHSHLWDNGPDPADELMRILDVRAAALRRFGENAIKPGEPMADIEDVLVPLYLLHRYQTEAASKVIGGLDYRYAVRGDGQLVTNLIPAAEQQKALAAVLKTLDPTVLTLPESLLLILPPRPPGYPRTVESFKSHAGLTFDAQSPVEASANLTASLLFEPSRATRLIEYHSRDTSLPGLDYLIQETLNATWHAPRRTGLELETQFTVEDIILDHLLTLAASGVPVTSSAGAAFPAGASVPTGTAGQPSPQASAIASAQVALLQHWIADQLTQHTGSTEQAAHLAAAQQKIERFLRDPEKFQPAPSLPTPPGQPIGDNEDF